jgi:hypothetical protein
MKQQNFENNGYVYLPDFLDKENCVQLTNLLKKAIVENKTTKDQQCPLSESIHGASFLDKLLQDLLPHFESASGLKLLPTYSYARLYAPNDELKIHRDRESCEISATITLGFEGTKWPIYMGDKPDGSDGNEILMNVGDAVLYKGIEKYHWRNKFEGKWQAQVFLHYVDANGKNAEWKYDKRKSLNLETQQFDYLIFDDVLTPAACDSLIKLYSNNEVPKELPFIGNGENVDLNIRNVNRVQLPTYKDIGGRLAAVGFSANHQYWKFDVTHASQSEFLMYDVNGRYVEHVDTFFNPNEKECRKLTILAFLNDDFEGGKFFIKNGHEKIYPKQTKGTILVFPSFMLHGVEDVTKGKRFSVVAWLSGAWFK